MTTQEEASFEVGGYQFNHIETSVFNDEGSRAGAKDSSFIAKKQWQPLDQIRFPLTNQATLEHRDKSCPDLSDFNYLSKCTSKLSVGSRAVQEPNCGALGIMALLPKKKNAAE